MEQGNEYRQQLVEEYKQTVMPLLRYLPWLEKSTGNSMSTTYQGDGLAQNSLSFPVYDGTLMNFIREVQKTNLMDRNYRYVYTRHRITTHEQERRLIEKCNIEDWDNLRGILSKYVLGGMTRGTLWNEGMQENIFYLVLRRMKEIIEYWDKPIDCRNL